VAGQGARPDRAHPRDIWQTRKTREGRLQVELAHLEYQRSRLVRSWTHLGRQRGGFGFLGGPGETQIESDRSNLRERISRIKVEIDEVRSKRRMHRTRRRRNNFLSVALVGYTNAGKSTLFNKLASTNVEASPVLFATLDPTVRSMWLPQGTRVVLCDTVGFISDLPPTLVAAFRATLEEVTESDLIVHVRDIANDETEAQREDVLTILRQIGLDPDDGNRLLEVWNKIICSISIPDPQCTSRPCAHRRAHKYMHCLQRAVAALMGLGRASKSA
jgi:GTPase